MWELARVFWGELYDQENVVQQVQEEKHWEDGVGQTPPPDIVQDVEAVAEDADEDEEREENDPDHVRFTVWTIRTFKLQLGEVKLRAGRHPSCVLFVQRYHVVTETGRTEGLQLTGAAWESHEAGRGDRGLQSVQLHQTDCTALHWTLWQWHSQPGPRGHPASPGLNTLPSHYHALSAITAYHTRKYLLSVHRAGLAWTMHWRVPAQHIISYFAFKCRNRRRGRCSVYKIFCQNFCKLTSGLASNRQNEHLDYKLFKIPSVYVWYNLWLTFFSC